MIIKNREKEGRGSFFIEDDAGLIAELTYRRKGNILTIDHTEVKRKVENRGIGSGLVRETVEFARRNNLKIEPLCRFAKVQFERNESYQDVRA
ncbi:GNAT family N-acetyltransferase [Christiangramia fulva]|uniref:GNAT family N-acetyltransferase n=1 Tax=Christiangramia fulva TaxID=2126553 RepID=A0A2R3Z5N2_9FLAO|nr:GNAT family N-acetyltransferase [Christiangramia fulva]AVR45559.1 GNAT family N-acetyltransferase [Christiangramia fulva]